MFAYLSTLKFKIRTIMKSKIVLSTIVLISLLIYSSCKKDEHIPPAISFKTGGNYTSADATLAKGASVTVGITGVKKEDDMKTYNISYAYDGATTTTTKETFSITGSDQVHYDKDYTFTVRSTAGIEKWYFTITDRDGNIAQLTLTLTVN
jgi:hypothetical protein